MSHSIICTIPMRLRSELNLHEHWRSTHKRRKAQRRTAYEWLAFTVGKAPALPLTVTLTRIAPRELDNGNYQASFKAVQDGVADWIDGKPFISQGVGGGQDRQEGLTWEYRQRRGKVREYALEIVVAKSSPQHKCEKET